MSRSRWSEAGLFGRVMVAAIAASCIGFEAPQRVRAFSQPESYLDDAGNGGGGGRWFTGSPAEGYGCDVCHTGGPQQARYPLHSEGFPATGYTPGQAYDLRLSWPEFAAHDQLVRDAMRPEPTSMGVIAEFVAESGIGSGAIEIVRKGASTSELCQFPPNSASSTIYQVQPGEEPAEVSRCEMNSVGARCVVAVKACGAQELRMRWTAPPQTDDSIWFSAGFVATDTLSGNPQNDSFAEVSGPLRPIGSEREYVSELNGGCSALRPGGRSGGLPLAALGLLIGCVVWRRRLRSGARLACAAAAFAVSIAAPGCADEEPATTSASLVGLYVPGNTLGVSTLANAGASAEATSDEEIAGYFAVPPGDRCVGMPASMAKGGTLRVEFKTIALNQTWGPANVGAVWIEDAAETYVKTLDVWAGIRKKSLYKWGKRACQMGEPDAVSGATLPMPGEHEAMWDGKDLKGNIVPDGLYRLYIEVTETESDVGRTAIYDIPKGPMPFMLEPPDAVPHQGLKISYTPMP